MSQPLSHSIEDYLEAAYQVNQEFGEIRIKNLSNKMGVSKPSTNSAVKILSKEGYLSYEKYGPIILTEKGLKLAKNIANKHEDIKNFLVNILNVNPDIADEEACNMEHYLSDETMNRLTYFIKYIQSCHLEKDLNWKIQFEKSYKSIIE